LGLPQALQGQQIDFSSTTINAGSTDDIFEFAGVASRTSFRINGGDGDDSLLTVNFAGNNHADDLGALFHEHALKFDGQGGNDFLDLDDSQAPASNDLYTVVASFNQNSYFAKNGVTLIYLAPETD